MRGTFAESPVLAPTGSVKDLFRENSYGALNLESTVVGWVDLPNTESFYAAGQSGLTTTVQQAINYIAAHVKKRFAARGRSRPAPRRHGRARPDRCPGRGHRPARVS